MIRQICGGLLVRRSVSVAPLVAVRNTVNVSASTKAMGPHAFHFKMERYFAAAIIPLFPAAYFVHGPFMDYALTAAIVLHSHWGIMAVVQDYARPLVIGKAFASMAPALAYISSVALLVGLLMFNYNDVGLTKAFEMIFSFYPAGHLHIFRLFYYLTDHGKNIHRAQYLFGVAYLANLLLVFRLYFLSGRMPPFVLPLICLTSYRVHSLFVLRLFNDPIAMLLFFVSLNLFVSRHYLFGCVLFSFAVSVKMNILLFAPALFFVLLLSNGFVQTVWHLAIALLIQMLLALEFIAFDFLAYVSKAFELGRVFLFQWTVNWRFLPEFVFVDRRFHIALLVAHLSFLAVFALKFWFRSSGGLVNSFRKMLFGVLLRLDVHGNFGRFRLILFYAFSDILFAFFSSNLIGMAFARSLHYQFYCWYYHSLPYLLFSPLYSTQIDGNGNKSVFSPKQIVIRSLLLLGVEFCWNVFPSTTFSSLLLHALHFSVIILSCRSSIPVHSPLKNE